MKKLKEVNDRTKKVLAIAVVILLVAATIVTVSALSPDEAAGKVCKAGLEADGCTCPWSPPWWWPFSDCMWYGLTCAQTAG